MDKTCLEIRDLMALGSDVASNERIAIESHVSVCAECSRELAEAQAMRNNLALLREGDLPAGTAERIWNRVRTAVPGSRRQRVVAGSLRAAAVLVIGLTVGFTAQSMAGLKAAPETRFSTEESSREESRATIVPRMLFHEGAGPEVSLPPPSSQPAPAPGAAGSRVLHYLPLVDEILEPGVVRF